MRIKICGHTAQVFPMSGNALGQNDPYVFVELQKHWSPKPNKMTYHASLTVETGDKMKRKAHFVAEGKTPTQAVKALEKFISFACEQAQKKLPKKGRR